MMRLRYSALSDVGRVRRDNQDAGYAGPHLLVVADGVGGAARGDVASSATVEVLRRLDAPPADDMLGALAGAIHLSHDRIASLVADSPDLEGTSTTVTAVIFDGAQIGVGHVGDSRGYLLRDGALSRLTTDHTFVQNLIDEGRITEDEARVHPRRNLILRAVDGVHEPEPDMFTLDLAPGDRIMLCSDGCSGALTDEQLTRLLADGTPDHAAVTLISASLDAGSSDNVTVVVADLVGDDAADDTAEDDGTSAAAATGPMLVGAAAEAPRRGSGNSARASDTGELPPVGDDADTPGGGQQDDVDPEERRYAPRPPRRFIWARRATIVGVVALLVTVVAVAGYRWTQDQYFVAEDSDKVAIFRGVAAEVPGVSMNSVEESSTLTLDELPTYNARQVREGISANSLDDARGIVSRLQRLSVCEQPTTSPSASPTTSPSASPSTSPSPSPSPSSTPGSSSCPEAP